jgi:phosphatidylserine decarboxylase
MHVRGPSFLMSYAIRAFAWIYHIDINLAEKPLNEYRSIGDFFSRRLRQGLRPVATSWSVHPCDSRILQHGPIFEGTLIQAKGRTYGVVQLTEDPEALIKYDGGYFLTYYLCPTDYHRVHSPVHGFVKSVMYHNGDLWPVNLMSVASIHKLYIQNERLSVELATEYGPVAVVMVGATNVGSMSLKFDSKVRTNRYARSKKHTYPVPLEINKGDELGTFHMGSTVIVLYSREFRRHFKDEFLISQKVRVGEAFTQS